MLNGFTDRQIVTELKVLLWLVEVVKQSLRSLHHAPRQERALYGSRIGGF